MAKEEAVHILDILLEKTRNLIEDKEIKIFLAQDDDQNEVLAVQKGEFSRGMSIEQIVHSFGVFRIYQADSEDAALDLLADNISKSIAHMLSEHKV
tara:strand:+ start:91 stop:378 length:288 start_codon:yes stop_codon:yes gene_type:complete